MEKIFINRKINEFNEEWVVGNVEDVLPKLQKFFEKCKSEGWKDLNFKLHQYYETTELELWGKRIETDAEQTDRLKKEEIKKKKLTKEVEKKKKQYLKLQQELQKLNIINDSNIISEK